MKYLLGLLFHILLIAGLQAKTVLSEDALIPNLATPHHSHHDNIDGETHSHSHKHGEQGEEHEHQHQHKHSKLVGNDTQFLTTEYAISLLDSGSKSQNGFCEKSFAPSSCPSQLFRPPII